jgi:hypothetical protein
MRIWDKNKTRKRNVTIGAIVFIIIEILFIFLSNENFSPWHIPEILIMSIVLSYILCLFMENHTGDKIKNTKE